MAVAGSLTYDTEIDKKGFEKGINSLKSAGGTALKAVGTAVTAITAATATAFVGLVTASVNARGELEQQIGGIETLFTNSLGSASDKVIENANKAYKTAGMSAINYMQTATSFSASLLQSLGNDTQKAAEVTDMAITDMSDNANKMGTSMQSIQDAYQGFAKQNYTMLDNLKLGYGGTKTEMERLLKDAQKLTGVKYNIDNLSDVYNAIHVIQGELGITGTTAKEASETLQGSFASMKAAWENFLSGSGDLSQVADTATDVVKNIIRIVNEAIPDIMASITESLPELLELGGQILQQLIQGIITYLPTLMESAGQILNNLIQGILATIPQLIPVALQVIQQLISGLIAQLPTLIQMGIEIISSLITGLAQQLPTLIPMALELILTLVMGLLDNIDQLIDAGINLIIGLAEGLINAIPVLIEKIPIIIEKLIVAIVNNLPKIIEAGIKIIVKLAQGLIKAIPQLVSKIPQIIGALVSGFGQFLSNMWDVGKNIVEGIWNGIKNAKDWLIQKIKEWCGSILDGIKSFFGIHSPSRVMRDEIGRYIPRGIAVGVETDTDEAIKAIDNMNNDIMSEMNRAVAMETGSINATASVKSNNSMLNVIQATFNIDGSVGIDGQRAGRILTPHISKTLRTGGAFA